VTACSLSVHESNKTAKYAAHPAAKQTDRKIIFKRRTFAQTRKAQSNHVTGCRPAEACSPQLVCYMHRSAGTHWHALPHCKSLYLLMCKECAACCIAARSYIEQQLTLARLLQELFGPGYCRQPEKGLGERCLHDKPRQTLDRSCASVQGHAGGVPWSELPAWNVTSHVLSESCRSFASRFGAQIDRRGTNLMKHLDSSFSYI